MRSLQLPLAVAGKVQAVVADQAILVTARENTVTVDLPNLRAGMVALRGAGGRKQRAKTLIRAGAALQFTDLNVEFRLAGGAMALLGADARPGLLSRLLGLAPLEIRLSAMVSLVRALWR